MSELEDTPSGLTEAVHHLEKHLDKEVLRKTKNLPEKEFRSMYLTQT